MAILKFDGENVDGLEESFGVFEVWVLTDASGNPIREIGFDRNREVVHRYPGMGKWGRFGIFDGARIPHTGPSDVSVTSFNEQWSSSR